VRRIIYFFEQSWLLIVLSFFFGLIIAAADAAWKDRIQQQQTGQYDIVAVQLLPAAASFKTATARLDITSADGQSRQTFIKKALSSDGNCAGWIFVCEGAGYASQVQLLVAADAGFDKILGVSVIACNETPGFGDKIKLPYYTDQFTGAPTGELKLVKTGDAKKIDSEIVAISGATISSQAVVSIINQYMPQVKKYVQTGGLISNGK
jgi:electron transport complex protein RnfG